ncbi:proton-translocating transhydrogenase family protein [Neoactinobaculum massilliense]|uniref:proton-translocating transhydrogenase family protein n=1 Tax=Neoactinobaculum massilliense TaxID=2364794 RepID=UPI001F15661D|nr:proton-translocating transhydrogenase family protein [Neoactinobaculum massilliense]
MALFVLLILLAPPSMASHFVVFMLACVVGFYVITAVTHALHTPLMSETNAISAIIVVGAIMQITSGNLAVRILAFIALTVAAINIFGGFTVTRRMLEMFKRS